ncbi:hypothetical protein FO519_005939 [Halicephalobus sp. NKZ332]|nr:hypothetical protein FO519_005939 [Halicephalobus sp. NKZ332]
MAVTVEFSVNVKETHPWDNVFVVGSHPKIGNWDPNSALELAPDDHLGLWKNKVTLEEFDGNKPLLYRYFIGYYLQESADSGSKIMVVSKWEAQFLPRSIFLGIHIKTATDEFGFYNGKKKLSNGWLHQPQLSEALLRFHGSALRFFKERYHQKNFSIKVVPFDLRHKEIGSIDDDGEESCDTPNVLPQLPSFSNIEVSNLGADDPHFRDQDANGEKFENKTDFLIFRTKTVAAEHLAFRFEFYLKRDKAPESIENNSEKSVFERTAIGYLMPTSILETFGNCIIPILAKNQQPIGTLTVDYLLVRALNPHVNQSMEVSFSKHWKKRIPLEIGHRGSGNSYTKFAAARENTVHSLNRASKNGADFVEFDVQLTKDHVAVIFHDFHVLVSVAKRSGSTIDLNNSLEKSDNVVTDYHELAVKDLKLNQLRLLHLNHHKAYENKDKLKVTEGYPEGAEFEPFPTLIDALRNVNMDTGFNVEVKYPMKMSDGGHECENYFERNMFIDVILNDVINNAGTRRIVFSSFDPDMCSLIALKQHKFPVLFLSIGETKRYVPFVDERTCTSTMAVNFAAGQDILGVNLHSEDILRDPSLVRRTKEMELVSFVWGDDLDDRENVKKMKELGLDGIIYDRIGEVEARQNIFTIERDVRSSLFSASPGPSRSGSLDKNPPFSGNNLPHFIHSLDIAGKIPDVKQLNVDGFPNGSCSSSSSTTNTPIIFASPNASPKRIGRYNEI